MPKQCLNYHHGKPWDGIKWMREHYLNHKIIPFDAHTRSLSLTHTFGRKTASSRTIGEIGVGAILFASTSHKSCLCACCFCVCVPQKCQILRMLNSWCFGSWHHCDGYSFRLDSLTCFFVVVYMCYNWSCYCCWFIITLIQVLCLVSHFWLVPLFLYVCSLWKWWAEICQMSKQHPCKCSPGLSDNLGAKTCAATQKASSFAFVSG